MKKTKKKKIAFYIDSLNRGGTERATVDLINNLNYDKYDVTLIKFFPGGEYDSLVRKEIRKKTRFRIINLFNWNKKIKYRVNWWGRNFFDRIPGKIRHKLLIGSKYDVEVACGYYFPTKFIKDSPRAKKISWVHMDYSIDRSDIGNFSREEGQNFFGKMDKIVCVSKECKEKFNKKFGLENLTVTRYNIIDTEKVQKKADEYVDEIFDGEQLNIVTVGRLTWQKGYDRLLRVHKRLIQCGVMHRLYIIGEGEEYDNLSKYIKDNNLGNTALLMGYKSNPYPYIKKADMFVCSSRHESFSLVVAESIVIGTPVLSTSCAGPNELLDNGKYGVITENSEEALYESLKKVLGSRERINELTQKVECRKNFFETKNTVIKWEEILDE